MNKETVLIKLGRVLFPRTVKFSEWKVDEAFQIPVREGRIPIPIPLPERQRQRTRFRACLTLVVLALGLCAGLSANASQSVSIAWNAATDPTTVGYIVYAGNSPTNYTAQLNVGTNTMITVTGLKEGTTNYFAVSAYNAANVAGTPSSAITYIVPGLMVMTPGAVPGSAPVITFPTAPGHTYQIQASTDMVNWSTIMQRPGAATNSWLSYADPNAAQFSKRFYRLIMQ